MKTKLAKITMAMLGVVMSLSVMAADNSIYIDQTGNNSTIAITQDGYGNVVKGIASGSTTPALINGINNSVTVNQIGISNTLSLGVQTTTGGTTTLPDGSTVSVPTINYRVTGNNATAVIDSNNDGAGASRGTYISVDQTGNNANANINVRGNNNAIKAVTTGDDNSVVATVKGNSNIDNVVLTGASNSVTISQGTALLGSNNNSVGIKANGASNTFGITQTGGTAGNSVSITGYATDTSYGSSNSVTVSQSGANDNSLVLGLTGSNNTIGVTQTATAGNNVANLKVNSSSSNISITQTNRQ
ncbi:Curlin associated [uncultured Caudovirales phage]|uniref:Curlin associated n=1 Tax=uncultured Caudovirales phage TaxID=2100421 RepID=A0A6J5L472_9CAUD|nr:Curlin associated [uncultured Caudovirales phage]